MRPQQLPRFQIVCEDLTLRSALENSSILDKRITNKPISGREIDRPSDSQIRHRLGVDLAQTGVVLYVSRVAEQNPVRGPSIARHRRRHLLFDRVHRISGAHNCDKGPH